MTHNLSMNNKLRAVIFKLYLYPIHDLANPIILDSVSKHFINVGYGYILPNCASWCLNGGVKRPNTLSFESSVYKKE